jgi:hypothetical protein
MKKLPIWKREKKEEIYPNQWIAVRVLESDDFGNPISGEILAHHINHDDLYRAIKKAFLKKKIYIFYNEVGAQEEVAIIV